MADTDERRVEGVQGRVRLSPVSPNSEIYPNIFLSEKEKFGGYSWSWAWKPRSAYVEFRIFLDINKGKRLSRSHAHGNPMGTAPFAAE
jgi:hypothetical protein